MNFDYFDGQTATTSKPTAQPTATAHQEMHIARYYRCQTTFTASKNNTKEQEQHDVVVVVVFKLAFALFYSSLLRFVNLNFFRVQLPVFTCPGAGILCGY